MNKLNSIRQFYRRFYKKHLIIVNSLQAGLLMVTGDTLAQAVVERKKKFDFKRTTNFFIIGVGYVGPVSSIWYQILSKYVSRKATKTVVVKKVLLDQLVFAPLSLCIFIILIHTIEGKEWGFIKNELDSKYLDILTTNYCVWPLVQLVNFYVMRLKYQVPFAQFIGVFWTVYLSWKVKKEQ